MRYDRNRQQELDARISRLILHDYQLCKERNLTSALDHLEQEVARRTNRINDITLANDTNKPLSVCHKSTLVTDTRDMAYIYKDESTVLPHVKEQFCSACDESV